MRFANVLLPQDEFPSIAMVSKGGFFFMDYIFLQIAGLSG